MRRTTSLLWALLVLPACEARDPGAELFGRELVTVEIDIDQGSWGTLRNQLRTRPEVFGTPGCPATLGPNPYTWFGATIRVDGVVVSDAQVRKKGFLGSQSTTRPSLKIRVGSSSSGGPDVGFRRFALNNSKSDPSRARTCAAYAVFAAAGVPAPRCTQAQLLVNGQDLGPYVLLEEVNGADFLRRHFRRPDGNLYEGSVCDFRPEFKGCFEQETNRSVDASQADIAAVTKVLESASDDELEAALGRVINLEAFYRFWAAETLVWHRDGYSGNTNNFFVYADPGDEGRFHFIPWGTDSTFLPDTRQGVPGSVLAFSAITYRLYKIPATRARYYRQLEQLFTEAWHPESLVAQLARMADTAGALVPESGRQEVAASESQASTFIRDRREDIARATSGGFPEWTLPLPAPGQRCLTVVGRVSGTFSSRWGTLGQSAFATGQATLTARMDGVDWTFARLGAATGATAAGQTRVQILADSSTLRRLNMTIAFPTDDTWFDPYLTTARRRLINPPVTFSIVEQDISKTPVTSVRTLQVGEGTWEFTKFAQTPGADVAGTFSGTVYR